MSADIQRREIEPEIKQFGDKIMKLPEWQEVIGHFDRSDVREDVRNSVFTLVNSVHYLLEADERDPVLYSIVLPTLQSEVSHMCRNLDDSSMSKLIASERSQYFLEHFSYSEAKMFRTLEEELIREAYRGDLPNIPDRVWQLFWEAMDSGKQYLVDRIRVYPREPGLGTRFAYNNLYRESISALHDDEGNFTPGSIMQLSPSWWRKAICVGLGAALPGINGILALPSAGIALASVLAGAVAVVVADRLGDKR